MQSDRIIRGMAGNDQIRFFGVDARNTVAEALALHQPRMPAATLLGRLICATAMLGVQYKDELSNLTLNIESQGELKGALIVYEPVGKIRCYAKRPGFVIPDGTEDRSLGSQLLPGTLSVIKDLRLKQPFIGTCELITGEIGEDIANYFMQSEQTPSAVSVGVLFDEDGGVKTAGGFIVQELPNADPKLIEKIVANIHSTPFITDLLDMGKSIETIMQDHIFAGLDCPITETVPLSYTCNCSRERFSRSLLLLGEAELSEMTDGIVPVCSFCNTQYEFTGDDIRALIAELGRNQG